MIINRESLRALFVNFSTIFQGAFAHASSEWDRFAMKVPSTTSEETYAWLGAMPGFREWIGDRVVNNLSAHGYTIRNKPWEMTIGVTKDDIEDDKYGVYRPMFEEMGAVSKTHPDTLVFNLLKRGFETRCYDGQNFFDTDHPVLNAAKQEVSVSNVQAGPGPTWYLVDDTRRIKPLIFQERKPYKFDRMDGDNDEAVFMRKEYRYGIDSRSNVGFGLWQLCFASRADLTAANYADLRQRMQSQKRDGSDDSLGVSAATLVVPPNLEGAAREILVADRTVNGASNTWKDTAKLHVCKWLA